MTAPLRHEPKPGDGWVDCRCGHRHWGLLGAAGLLLVRRDERGHPTHVVLQHRAPWSHHGGTWGVPGGARMPGESAAQAALREAHEEAGIDPASVVVRSERVLTHPDWSYTTVVADERTSIEPQVTDDESVEVAWVAVVDVATLPLLPAFGAGWPDLLADLQRH
ncbi:NUDIX domain-containing protein [Cellulomonas sp. HZM]|uniref:NUDIX domain-containing protein n=1 Tax=Cellulomonas sp. HZM TaxID=1454010 RepID=UPI0004935534|nr:NUDIX domain-containing protein [Cellulomonas sp. HZM]